MRKTQQEVDRLPKREQTENVGTVSGACMHEMLLYAFDHLDENYGAVSPIIFAQWLAVTNDG